jgi:predicted GNAT family N-acyltransferase
MLPDIFFKQIDYSIDDAEFQELIDLRYRLLRKPLGLKFEAEELANETNDIHIAGYSKSKLLACLVMTPISKSIVKMRQVCVSKEHWNRGIGAKLVQFAEDICRDLNVASIVLNARETALNLYLKGGYKIKGEMFIELGIPHYKMTKQLQSFEKSYFNENRVAIIGESLYTNQFLKELCIESPLEYVLDNKYYKATLSLKTTDVDEFEPGTYVALILVFESVIIF